MQFDAAVSPVVGQLKFPGSPVAGHANTFIFPCIKPAILAIRSRSLSAASRPTAPILQGLNAPINDLSRGCDAEEVYQMSIIGGSGLIGFRPKRIPALLNNSAGF